MREFIIVVILLSFAVGCFSRSDLRKRLDRIEQKIDVFLNNYGTEGVPPRKDLI